MDDLDEVWSDDQLIERLARGEAPDDPAVAPLLALSRIADSVPAPATDLDPAGVVDDGRNRRYAVRSLAVAVTAVVTLSTSGVAAVVTGDPLRPAKAVWQEIQEQTGRSAVAQVETGEALGAALPADPAAGEADTAGDAPARQPWEIRPSPVSAPSASLAADQDPAALPEPGTAPPSTADGGGPTPYASPSATDERGADEQDADGTTAAGDTDREQHDDGATTEPEDGQQDDGQQPTQDGSEDQEPDGRPSEDPKESPTPDDETPDDDIEPPLLRTPAPQEMRSPEPTLDPELEPTPEQTLDETLEPTATDDATVSETDLAEESDTPDGTSTLDGTDGTLDGTDASLSTAP